MLNLNGALNDSLKLAIDRFKTADADLREACDALAKAVNAASNEALVLELLSEEHFDGAKYKLVLVHKANSEAIPTSLIRPTCEFRIPGTGYPIEQNSYHEYETIGAEQSFADKAALEAFFTELAGKPDSPLVLQAAVMLTLPIPEAEKDTGIPF